MTIYLKGISTGVESPRRGDVSHGHYFKSVECTLFFYSHMKKIWVVLQCLEIYLIRYTPGTRVKYYKLKKIMRFEGKIRVLSMIKRHISLYCKR